MSRASGGSRAVKAKHDERDARRRRGKFSEKEWRARAIEHLGDVPIHDLEKLHEWTARAVALAMAEAIADPGPPLEQRREQIGRLAAQLSKAIEPAKLSERLERLEKALKEPHGAREVTSGTVKQS